MDVIGSWAHANANTRNRECRSRAHDRRLNRGLLATVSKPLGTTPVCWAQMGSQSPKRKQTMTKLFPTILVALDICAAIMYVPCGDIRHIIYWIAAAVLTACVTY